MNLLIVLRNKTCFWVVEWIICVVKVCFWAIFALLWAHPDSYIQMINLHQTWYATSLSISNYCCGVRKFWPPFIWCLWMETHILSLKWCINDAAKGNLPHLSNYQCFRWWFAYEQRLNPRFVVKGEGYPELQLIIWDFSDISIDFYPKEAMEFTATAPVFKWQHITAFRM